MEAHLLLAGPRAMGGCGRSKRSRIATRSRRWVPIVAASASASSPSWTAIDGDQNHYAVLGLSRDASPTEIKRAFRLLARKYHPDVSKDPQGSDEAFKSIRRAYEILSNDVTRIQYDRALRFKEETGWRHTGKRSNINFQDVAKIRRWAELRRKMQQEKYQDYYNATDNNSSHNDWTVEENLEQERSSFVEILKTAFMSLFLLQTFGSRLSLTVSSFIALLDRKLDAGYKIGYVIAWFLGGRGGILLTLCLSFASWVCGKSSSSIVALAVVAMWVGSHLASYAPLPQGAVLTLLYMSIKLHFDFK